MASTRYCQTFVFHVAKPHKIVQRTYDTVEKVQKKLQFCFHNNARSVRTLLIFFQPYVCANAMSLQQCTNFHFEISFQWSSVQLIVFLMIIIVEHIRHVCIALTPYERLNCVFFGVPTTFHTHSHTHWNTYKLHPNWPKYSVIYVRVFYLFRFCFFFRAAANKQRRQPNEKIVQIVTRRSQFIIMTCRWALWLWWSLVDDPMDVRWTCAYCVCECQRQWIECTEWPLGDRAAQMANANGKHIWWEEITSVSGDSINFNDAWQAGSKLAVQPRVYNTKYLFNVRREFASFRFFFFSPSSLLLF